MTILLQVDVVGRDYYQMSEWVKRVTVGGLSEGAEVASSHEQPVTEPRR